MSTPSSTWGNPMAQAWTPNRRTDKAWTHKAPGNLSTETVPAGSKAA